MNIWAKVSIPRMLSGHLQGRTLSMLSKMIRPKTILEIYTYIGYSAICSSEGLQTKLNITYLIDINEDEKHVSYYFEKANISKQVCQHGYNALNIIPSTEGSFDLVFIDVDKENYSNYFDPVICKLSMGGSSLLIMFYGVCVVEDEDGANDLETKR